MSNQHINLQIEGMTCNNCALGIRKSLEKQGLQDVDVSFANGEAGFTMDSGLNLDDVIENIEKLGFEVVDDDRQTDETDHWSALEWKLLISAIFAVPLLLAMFLPLPFLHSPTVQLLLCLPPFIIGLEHFGGSAIRSLRNGVANMDVLIILGATAAFLYSLYGYTFSLGHNFMFWETAAMIITLVLLGNVIEHRTVKKTTSALKELGRLQPAKARLVKGFGLAGKEQHSEIDARKLKSGDIFLVNTGERVATDGLVLKGNGTVNEAMLTGESMPIDKTAGQEVTGGTVLQAGNLFVKATRTGKDTVLAQIIELVRKAQADQPPVHRLADRISAVFVPLVIAVTLLTFVAGNFWFNIGFQQAMLNAIAVLVIACPCAMGLATPTALSAGLGRAAKNGILIKGGTTMETLAKVKNVVFDKTGTLTTGQFGLQQMHSELPQPQFKAILLGLERYSNHPLAKSLVRQLENGTPPLELEETRELKGMGITGKDAEGNTYTAGSHKLAAELTGDGSHNIYVTKNDRLLGWVDMEDELRPDAADCIAKLNRRHLNTFLLSGDREEKTRLLAQKTGIKEYYSEKLPSEKPVVIDNIMQTGPTAMVGDGINDAPALARANVGISLSDASQIAIQSADVVLLNNGLKALDTAVGISQHTLLTVKQNLFWAFFYNIVAIPLAAVGLLSPMVAAFVMAFSDVFVIGNSLRLRSKKLD